MGLIIRYILRELGVTFLFGFVALTFLLLIIGVVQKALEFHIPLVYVWQFIPTVFAQMSPISLPITLLLAVSVFFSRMSGSNEVIALKALGIPPKAFLMPVFVIACIFSLIGVGISELAITHGRQATTRLLYLNAENLLFEQLTQEHSYATKNNQITIHVKGVDGQRRLREPRIMFKKESVTIVARSAQITIDYSEKILRATLTDFRMTGEGGLKLIGPERTHEFPLSEFFSSEKSDSASDMGLIQINQEQKITAERIEEQRRLIAAHRTFDASMGSVDAWATPEIEKAKKTIRRLQSHQQRLSVEPPRRWATGFCCFFFVWLGAPLAIWMRKSDFFSSFFACFVPILLLYYPLLMIGVNSAKDGSLPPMCVWIANGAIGLIGLWFLRQIHRY